MKLAIMGLGEVGRCYAQAFHAQGIALQICKPRPSDIVIASAQACAAPLHPEPAPWLASCDVVLSCVTGAQACRVAEQAAAHLEPGTLYADFTTASPTVKRAAAAHVAAAGAHYVDTAIMGAIALHGVRTPLLAAGDGAEALRRLFARVGGQVQVLEGAAAGDAIALKILRSIYTKGMEALAVELLSSAEKQGVREQLYAQLADIDAAPMREFIETLVRTHVVHARRRAHEVRDARVELASQGLTSLALAGVEQRFLDTAARLEARPLSTPNPDIDEALQWLLAPMTLD